MLQSKPQSLVNRNTIMSSILILMATVWPIDASRLIEWQMVPSKVMVIRSQVARTGYIVSPSYPHSHPINSSCNIVLLISSSLIYDSIRIEFLDFDLDQTNACQSSSVRFRSGKSAYASYMACGSSAPESILLTTNQLEISFSSDAFSSGNKRGFKLRFEFLQVSREPYEGLCRKSTEFRCRNRRCIPKGLRCNSMDDCGDASDEDLSSCKKLTMTYRTDYLCGLTFERVSLNDDNGIYSHNQQLSNRVLGGRRMASASWWPFQVSIQYFRIESVSHLCGATLVHPKYVLTASHCLRHQQLQNLRLVFGSGNLKIESITTINNHVQTRYIQRAHIFPGYNDLALIELNAPVELTAYAWPACLPHLNEPIEAERECLASGFGTTRGTGDPLTLKRVLQIVKHSADCATPYTEFELNDFTMICAKNPASAQGLCQGDSGGPLLCSDKNSSFSMGSRRQTGEFAKKHLPLISDSENKKQLASNKHNSSTRYSLYGITSVLLAGSTGSGYCGLAEVPTIFSRVSVYVEWIVSLIISDLIEIDDQFSREQLNINRSSLLGFMFRSGQSYRNANFASLTTKD